MQRESMHYDVVIVGGGPAGLSAAIRLGQLAQENSAEISVCLIDKGAEIGAHLISGAIMDPRALDELIPGWTTLDAPCGPGVTRDEFHLLTENDAWRLPRPLLPDCLHNAGGRLLSLGALCRWLGRRAEALGAEIYAGFAGTEVLYDAGGAVAGVATGEMGRQRDGHPGAAYQPGVEIFARYTLFAEGCRGQLGRQLETHFGLRGHADPQTYALGFKELWETPAAEASPGAVRHTCGWPLDGTTHGGGFVYDFGEVRGEGRIALGFVAGLDYRDPYFSPFDAFQRFKAHPQTRARLAGGRRLAYGARCLTVGGLSALPRLAFPGGALLGDDAGLLNAARIKGIHGAIKSGSLAAEAAFAALVAGRGHDTLTAYPAAFRESWLFDELNRTRNFKPWLAKGLFLGGLMFGVEQHLLRGKAPWTLHRRTHDHSRIEPAAHHTPTVAPPPDNIVSFDRRSSVHLANLNHSADQPCHLRLTDDAIPIAVNWVRFAAPETRYCPAGVFELEFPEDDAPPRLRINAQDCLHCKACDIKDPTQNIVWTAPQGGEGPSYPDL